MHKPTEVPGDWERWLPPPPHAEMVRVFLRHARATLVWESPDQPPVLACEDGGMIPLPQVRYDEVRRLYAADDPTGSSAGHLRLTRFSDVCASIDRIKSLWAAGETLTPEAGAEINRLLDDALYMIERLGRRHEEYNQAAVTLLSLAQALLTVATPEPRPATHAAALLRHQLEAADGHLGAHREHLDNLAEMVRDVAQRQEDRARDKKELWLALGRLYRQVRGPRDWSEAEAEPAAEANNT